MVADLGRKRAAGLINSEDFPSDTVSAYYELQKQHRGVAEGSYDFGGRRNPAEDESNLLYIYKDGRVKQAMISNYNEKQARAEGFRDTQEQALRLHNIIRSKFNPKKWVQKQGGSWVEVFPFGQPNVSEDTDAGADDQATADQNIIMQIRKASDYEKPTALKLADGTSVTIAPGTADKMLAKFDMLKPDSKELMQSTLNTAEGFRDMLNYFNEREITESMLDVNLISNHMKPILEAESRAKKLVRGIFGK
jgi:hypothetical protein